MSTVECQFQHDMKVDEYSQWCELSGGGADEYTQWCELSGGTHTE